MRTTQYIRQEKAIASADRGGIYERWHWGLRLLRDPEAMASEKSLRHGVADDLIAAAAKAGFALTAREIQYRIQCARTYKTEGEIRTACSDFDTWSDLRAAGFPTYDADPDEPLADHRTKAERARDIAKAAAAHMSDQLAFWPLSDFEPDTATLKELSAYAVEMAEMTARFAARDAERREYLDTLLAAVDGDESATWSEAHRAAYEQGLISDPEPDTDNDGAPVAS